MSSKKQSVNYNTALSNFFRLKQKYDDNYYRTKKKYVKNKKLTTEQKRKKIKAIKRKCVICKKVGGMEFTNIEGHYKATCKAETPCNLDINLKRGHYLLMPEILEKINIEKNHKMGDIIKLKLSLLFGLKEKDIVTKEFQSEKDEYKNLVDSMQTIQTILNQLNETTIDDDGEEKKIPTKDFIFQLNERLVQALKDFKEIIHEYNNPVGDEKSIIVLQRAIELYLETIVPIQDKIRRASYAYNEVETESDDDDDDDGPKKYSLIQEKHTLEQLEINLPEHEPEVKNMKLR